MKKLLIVFFLLFSISAYADECQQYESKRLINGQSVCVFEPILYLDQMEELALDNDCQIVQILICYISKRELSDYDDKFILIGCAFDKDNFRMCKP